MKIAEPNIRERRFDVTPEYNGWRLDLFLAARLRRLSRSKARKICKFGDVEVIPFRPVKPSLRLQKDDLVILREHLQPENVQYSEVEILYEDDDLLVINKPAGMLAHETASTRQNTVEYWLKYIGYDGAQPVHRLDRETSGCMVCGKDDRAVAALSRFFAEEQPLKSYVARVLDPGGRWQVGAKDVLTTPLGLVDSSSSGVVPVRMGRGPLSAKTQVHVVSEGQLDRFGRYADLHVRIFTGRQHQIRVHLAFEGTPVAGDKLYTYDDDFFIAITDDPNSPELLARLPYRRHALHAQEIGFRHPKTGQMIFQHCDWKIESWT